MFHPSRLLCPAAGLNASRLVAAVVLTLGLVLQTVPFARPAAAAEGGVMLWQIGKPDGANAEFALAPGGFNQFRADGLFVVGESDPQRDWPYVQPGPHDAWAGQRTHTFAVLFGLKSVPAAGECRLDLDLLDTHGQAPPKLRIAVNGQAFERDLPKGAGDDSVMGQPAKGLKQQLAIAFPASLLRSGDNEIGITTLTGSWLLYDAITLTTPPGAELTGIQSRTLVDDVEAIRALQEQDGKLRQPVLVTLRHFGPPTTAVVRVEGAEPARIPLEKGVQTIEVLVPAVEAATQVQVNVEVAGQPLAAREVTLKPTPQLTVYILPHSHTDIGYTEIQTEIEKRQVNNLVEGIRYAKQTADYPAGARFVWNVEVLWAADLYLRRLDKQQQADFFEAVRRGQVALCGMYLNELTGLCRPEELVRLFRYATKLSEQTGTPIDSAMISDVPGYTWGTVPAMAQAGIKYFSVAPNYFDRIGTILREWENKPFYWVGPDGRSKVLVWIPFWGYAMSHRYGQMSPRLIDDFCDGLEKRAYPYDIAHVRWSGHGDNAVPDPAICEFVRQWNAKYAWPKFIISSASEAFRAFEQRDGDRLPLVRGDWTPYWEDGAGSSALETALNRNSSDRLAQAETLWAMRDPATYPAAGFEDAWNNVLLYSEHTWGAYCSVTGPERKETKEQWDIKQSYALSADRQSRELFDRALAQGDGQAVPGGVDVFNTGSWPRTELVTLSKELSAAGDRVTDDTGRPVASQRLGTGELVFVADVPPLAARRYTISAGEPYVADAAAVQSAAVQPAKAQGATLDNGLVHVGVDEKTGGIVDLRGAGIAENLADTSGGEALNDYLYLIGDDLAALQRNGPVTIRVKESGPLVAALSVESDAPGCKRLLREIRITAGFDHVELGNLVDKQRLAADSYMATQGKESVNFAFPFHVPDGQMRLDVPLGAFRPELDQMPSACKNWLTVGRWADVANADFGVTWVTLDAPLAEVGGITARLLNSQADPEIWRKTIEPTQKLYCWAMNNHWGTNYRAYQEGPTLFRFVLRPHRQSDLAAAARFATSFSQPLQPVPARGAAPSKTPLLSLSSADVLVMALKPSDDGKAWIVRLFGASGKDALVKLTWSQTPPPQVWLSDTSEKPLSPAPDAIAVPGWGLVTLRAQR